MVGPVIVLMTILAVEIAIRDGLSPLRTLAGAASGELVLANNPFGSGDSGGSRPPSGTLHPGLAPPDDPYFGPGNPEGYV